MPLHWVNRFARVTCDHEPDQIQYGSGTSSLFACSVLRLVQNDVASLGFARMNASGAFNNLSLN